MRQFNPDTDCILVADNHHGRFMPYRFCMDYEDSLMAAGFKDQFFEIIWTAELRSEDWQSHDDAWCSIMDNYVHKENGREWVLMYGPCGDLFLVATDVELPDWE